MVAILKRELSSYFNSAVAYVVMAVYFLFSGLFFSMICIENDTSSLSYVFGNMFIIILFIIPIITMKSFSEEKRQRTDQALLTSPTSLFEIVMGKFLGALILFAICSLIFVVYALVISFFTSPDWAVVCRKDGLETGAVGIYFIVETKAGKLEKDLTDVEVNKIRCGELHFKAVSELVKFNWVNSYEDFKTKFGVKESM